MRFSQLWQAFAKIQDVGRAKADSVERAVQVEVGLSGRDHLGLEEVTAAESWIHDVIEDRAEGIGQPDVRIVPV